MKAAADEGIAIIAITDHNEVSAIPAAQAAGAAHGVFVVPGVELSTPEGHLLCYAPTYDAIERFFNRLDIADRRTDNCRCQNGMLQCLKRLSLGQQQSVLLALMLTSESRAPLIVDQPEDNLDSEFIYKTLVPVIRAAKERRLVIVVTHNANIAVLGDAELIVALKATNEKASVVSRGSIDHPPTCELACAILEGSREAFDRRAQVYGAGRR